MQKKSKKVLQKKSENFGKYLKKQKKSYKKKHTWNLSLEDI